MRDLRVALDDGWMKVEVIIQYSCVALSFCLFFSKLCETDKPFLEADSPHHNLLT